jgi:protease-4
VKKIFLFLLLVPFSLNCFSLPWFSKSQPVTPKVVAIEIFDPINFKDVAGELFRATKREDVVGVILMVSCNGGSVGDFSVIHDMVKKLASVKPVVSLVGGSAYSCGYMVASAADVIFAHSSSDIGSIGVYIDIKRYSNVSLKNDGIEADVKTDLFTAGEFKALTNPYGPELTDAQRTFMQAQIMKTYYAFIALVAQNRGLNKEDYKIWAEGKVFDAPEALELGLIDAIGTIFDVEDKIKQLIVKRNPNFGSTTWLKSFLRSADVIEFVY